MKKYMSVFLMMALAVALSGCPFAKPPAPQVVAQPEVDTCGRTSIIANAPRGAEGQFELYKGELLVATSDGSTGKLVEMEEVVPKDAQKHHGYTYYRHYQNGRWNYYQLVGNYYHPVNVAYIGAYTPNPAVKVAVLLIAGAWILHNINGGSLDFDFGVRNDGQSGSNKIPYAIFPITDSREAEYSVGFIADGYNEPTMAGPWTLASDPNGCAPPADTTPPVISIVGASTITVNCGNSFADPGATATDDRDGDISGRVNVAGSVNTNVAGDYTLTYTVSDNSGNTATPRTRTVRVVGPCPGDEGPALAFTLRHDHVPGFNDRTDTILRGTVVSNAPDLGPYAVGTYLYIPGVGWSGPFPPTGAQPDSNGRFTTSIVGHSVDFFATRVVTFLVDDTVELPTCNVCSEPPLVPQSALAFAVTDRSAQAQPEIVLDYVPACRDESNTVLSGYILDVAPHPNAVVAYLDIPGVGWSGPFPGEGGFITEDGRFAINVVGHPIDMTATRIRLFVVPDWTESPTCNTCTQAPWIAENLAWTDGARECAPEQPVNQAPTIRLNGSATVSHPRGQPYTDPGATATDPEDGDISAFIVVTGSVNVNTPGVYTLRYNVRDSQGLAATEVTRTVTVTSPDEPVVAPTIGTVTVNPDSGEVTVTFDGWTEEGAALVKVELLAEINFADHPWFFWGLVTKPGDLEPHYFPVNGPSIVLTYNQDFGNPVPRDWTARRLVVRLLSANASTQFLDTDTSVADGNPLNLPNLISGQVLGSVSVDINTKQVTLSGEAYYNE